MDEENKKAEGYGKRPFWQWVLLYAVVALVLYGLFYYFVLAKNGANPYSQTGTSQQNITPTTVQVQTSPASVAASEKITVEGSEFAFIPSTITLKKGQTAEITFKNVGKFPHNLTISDLGVASKTIQPGEQDTFTVTPDKIGQFAFICTVPGHADKGMKGTLTVE
jgi:nitrite reductase (NO-forming)